MMKKIDANYQEQFLLPPSIEDWISVDHPARFIREFVDQIDLREIGIKIPEAKTGRPPYSEELLLRVWLYGYWKHCRSSRKLEDACENDVGFIWLCGRQAPDHNTLWRFFKANKSRLKNLFKQTVQVATGLKMVGFVMQAVDGSKIQAACGGKGSYDEAHLRKLLERLDTTIADLEKAIEAEAHSTATQPGRLPKKLQNAGQLREKVKEALAVVQSGGARHCHPTDPEARRMGCEGRNRFSQNAQAVVDEQEQIIVAQDVTQAAEDTQQLTCMAKQTIANTERAPEAYVADGGYFNAKEIGETEELVGKVLSPIPSGSENKEENPYHRNHFDYDAQRDVVICPEGKKLGFARERLKNPRTGHTIREYRNAAACRTCAVRQFCTTGKRERTIEIPKGYEAVQRMKKRLETPENQEKLKKRGQTVELIFAWIKQIDGFRRWTMHGLENAKAQWSMLCAVRNLKQIYKHWLQRERKTGRGALLETAKTGNVAQSQLKTSHPGLSGTLCSLNFYEIQTTW